MEAEIAEHSLIRLLRLPFFPRCARQIRCSQRGPNLTEAAMSMGSVSTHRTTAITRIDSSGTGEKQHDETRQPSNAVSMHSAGEEPSCFSGQGNAGKMDLNSSANVALFQTECQRTME